MKRMTTEEKERFSSQLKTELMSHVGSGRSIGMGELYVRVFGKPWENRINDTRRLRDLITDLRRDGVAICSRVRRSGGGYYLASAGSELEEYCKGLETQALKKLAQVSRLRKMSLPELMGQMHLDLVPKG